MNQGSKTVTWVIIAIIVVIGLYTLFNWSSTQTNGSTIKIGFMGPLSGELASLGGPALAAAELAVKEVNDAGGIGGKQLELIAEDSQCNSTGGTNAANKLVNIDGVTAIVGGLCSSETAPAAPIAQSAGVPLVSYCASAPGITKVGDYIFRTYPSDAFQAPFGATYAFEELGKKKVAILYVKNDWGQGMHDGFVKEFQKLGGTIVYDESFAQDARDLRTQLAKVKSANPDLIAFYSYTESGIVGLKQMQELGIKTPVLGGDAFDDPKISQEAKDAAEGVRYSVPHLDVPSDFNAKLKAATGQDAKVCAPQAYDAVKLLAQVMNETGDDRVALRDGLATVAGYEGVSGAISFNPDGDILNAVYDIKVIKDGQASVMEMTAQ